MKTIRINTEYITLSAFLKWCGVAETGGEAKNRIIDGEIKVNGEVCTMRGKKLRVGDQVDIDGETYKVAN